jgi:hypothetical protein
MKILARVGKESYFTRYIVEITDTELHGLGVEVTRDENPREIDLRELIEKHNLKRQQNAKVRELIGLLDELRPKPTPSP